MDLNEQRGRKYQDSFCKKKHTSGKGSDELYQLGEPMVHSSSQLCLQWHHTGSLKLAVVGVFTPWETLQIREPFFFFLTDLIVKHLGLLKNQHNTILGKGSIKVQVP